MLVTQEQQQEMLTAYIKERHTTDECIGFIDGINATLELIDKLLKNENNNKS